MKGGPRIFGTNIFLLYTYVIESLVLFIRYFFLRNRRGFNDFLKTPVANVIFEHLTSGYNNKLSRALSLIKISYTSAPHATVTMIISKDVFPIKSHQTPDGSVVKILRESFPRPWLSYFRGRPTRS